MYRLIPIFLLILSASSITGQKDLDKLKADAAKSSGGQQAKLYAQIAEHLVDLADEQFNNASSVQAQATVQELLGYADKAHNAAIHSRDHRKEVEIILRRTQRHLDSVKRTLAAEDRPPLDAVEKKLEEFRQELIDSMFAPAKKDEK